MKLQPSLYLKYKELTFFHPVPTITITTTSQQTVVPPVTADKFFFFFKKCFIITAVTDQNKRIGSRPPDVLVKTPDVDNKFGQNCCFSFYVAEIFNFLYFVVFFH